MGDVFGKIRRYVCRLKNSRYCLENCLLFIMSSISISCEQYPDEIRFVDIDKIPSKGSLVVCAEYPILCLRLGIGIRSLTVVIEIEDGVFRISPIHPLHGLALWQK